MAATTSEKELTEQLKQVPLFSHTSAKQRKTLAKLGKVLTWREGSEPIKQGSKGAAFFLILDGSVEVSRDDVSLARLGEGDFVGEVALLANQPRNADVTALAPTTVFAFGRPALAAALKTDPNLGLALLEAMAIRQQATL
ncbi:MAG: cyclic nucleotide-binding domain-containing protein [Actinomycetota bacterium]